MLYSSFEVALTDNQTNSGGGVKKACLTLTWVYRNLTEFHQDILKMWQKFLKKVPHIF